MPTHFPLRCILHNFIGQDAIMDSLLIEYDNNGTVEDNENDYGEFDIMLFDNEFSNKDIVQSDRRQQMLEVRDISLSMHYLGHILWMIEFMLCV